MMLAAQKGSREVAKRRLLTSLLPPDHHQTQTQPESFRDAFENTEGRSQIETQIKAHGNRMLPPSCTPMAAGMKKPRAVKSMDRESRQTARHRLTGWPRSQKIR
jgi:hypothetical protein